MKKTLKPRARILSPRWTCWRCKGRRFVMVPTDAGEKPVKCPSCHETDPANVATGERRAA